MKCPKCLYIGFETGERCKNCGYDFSLLAIADEPEVEVEDLPLRLEAADESPDFDVSSAMDDVWTEPAVDRFRDLPDQEAPALALSLAGPSLVIAPVPARTAPAPPPPAVILSEPALPLFAPDAADDEPLVKLPAVPRVPLAVRKTPDVPRLRQTRAPEPPRLYDDSVLQFVEDPDGDVVTTAPSGVMAAEPDTSTIRSRGPASFADTFVRTGPSAASDPEVSPFARRLMAAAIDHGILLSIDFVVLYFTLRLTDLSLADWHLLPVLPMAAFLLSLKVAYLSAFTAAGGQTIGKMAMHIRVVSDDGGQLDPGRALRRALLGLASIVAAGAPFLTALGDPARRGVHDRASGTRVVALAPR